jgi:hypothetical protein
LNQRTECNPTIGETAGAELLREWKEILDKSFLLSGFAGSGDRHQVFSSTQGVPARIVPMLFDVGQ